MRTFDLTRRAAKEQPALLQEPVKKIPWWHVHTHLWTAMQHVAYFFSSPSLCCYCLAWRMFFVGLFVGIEVCYFWPWVKVW